jgi:3'(2'), 5'-bisphosphate nucleotidase
MKLELDKLLQPVLSLAKEAGKEILSLYRSSKTIEVIQKADASPVTEADMNAHNIIVAGLQQLSPNIPILSEEAANIPYTTRSQWSTYWLIDPLDGTKEFLHRTDDFTVNIALINDHQSILGVIVAPVFDVSYFSYRNGGAFKQLGQSIPQKINVRPLAAAESWLIAISRHHSTDGVKRFLDNINQPHELITKGSSLKSCLVAEGQADIYPCLGKTSEWDLAAAQCIVEEAGGKVMTIDRQPLRYNVKSSLLNPPLLVFGDDSFHWFQFVE